MLRFIGFVVVVAAAFGGGFYSGVVYHDHEAVQNPDKFIQLYKKALSEGTKDKIDVIKKYIHDKTKK